MNESISFIEVEERILTVREQQVLIDRDVAELYGVETREVNQAVKNNPEKFPKGYTFSVDNDELCKHIKNFDMLRSLKHSRVEATVFTEKGLYMLATILKSPAAAQTTIAIVETFTKIRELTRAISLIPSSNEEAQKKALMRKSGEIIAEIIDDNSLEVSGDETTIELDLALVKVKHTRKREKRKE